MLASRYANPDAVDAQQSPRKGRSSLSGSKSLVDEGQSNSTHEHREESKSQAEPTPEDSLAKSAEDPGAVISNDSPPKPDGLSYDGSPRGGQGDEKPLPPLPREAELESDQNPSEPSVVLASSPGATTPEIAPSTPVPTGATTEVPKPSLDSTPTVAEPSNPAEAPKPDPAPKTVSPAPIARSPGKVRRTKAGKGIFIRLPADKKKTYSGYPTPMSLEDFRTRIDDFEKAGYDTRGFGYWKDPEGIDVDTRPAQARREFPDPIDQQKERQQREFSVSVPDRQRWDDYVSTLVEEKLRSLGVTPGNDDPTPPTLSRQVSSPYPPLPVSPPVPSSSSASQHMWQNTMPFSAPFSPAGSTNNTSIGPVASPAPSLGQSVHPGHISRQSTFGFPFPNAPTQFGMQQPWSPQQMNNMQEMSRGASPAVPTGLKQTTPGFSYESPRTPHDRETTPRGQANISRTNSRAEQASSWRSNLQLAQVENAATQEVNVETKGETKSETKDETNNTYADLASPKPQGHRHNISENLEREAEQYYPGEYVNESRDASPQRGASANSSSEKDFSQKHKSRHVSNVSTSSRLNIEAKEFKYDPTSSNSRNFSMTTEAFLPNSASKMAKAADATSSVQLATAHSHQGSISLSNLNVAAPEFKPPAQNNFAFSSSWFNFTSKKPTEQPTDNEATKEANTETKPSTFGSRIFGNIADIVKPPKKSKAVPIVDPKEVERAADDSFEEDEDGRIGPGELRRKKGRFEQEDGDSVPLFAEPTPEPQLGTPVNVQSTSDSIFEASDNYSKTRGSEQDNGAARQQPLTLNDELDNNENLSDGSNVPWHGVEGDDNSEAPARPTQLGDTDLLTSPAAASGIEDFDVRRDTRGVSPRSPTSQHDASVSGENLDNDDSLLNPSAQELDAVMDYINKENSDFELADNNSISREKNVTNELFETRAIGGYAEAKSDQTRFPESRERSIQDNNRLGGAISQASNRASEEQAKLSRHKSISPTRPGVSPVRKLNKMNEGSVSDWNDMLSSGEELNIPPQRQLNDAHVATLVEGLLRRHLAPFEKQLNELSATFKKSTTEFTRSRPFSSYEKSESDADDEDDENATDNGSRLRSRGGPKSDRRSEQIRSAVMDALAASQSDGIGQIEQEVKFRKAAEGRADDLQRLLALSEREISLLKEATANSDEKVRNLEQEQTDLRQRHKAVEDELRTKTLNFTTEVATLENTVDEYRTSSTKWHNEIEYVKKAREELERNIQKLKGERDETQRQREEMNEKLIKAEEELKLTKEELITEKSTWERKDQRQSSEIESLHAKLTEAVQMKDRLDQGREELNEKLTKAEEDLKSINTKLMTERSTWERNDQKQSSEIEGLQGKLDNAVQAKDRLDQEVTRMHQVERDAIKTAVILEETQNAKTRLEETVNKLNEKAIEHQTIVARYEREASEAHENTSLQVERTKSIMQTDIAIANKKVENTRADLETRLEMTRSELNNVRRDNEAVRERYEKSLNEAIASRKEALQEAADSSKAQLQEERHRFEQSLNDVSFQHDRALRNAIEDKQRSETHLNSSLKLAEAKVSQLEDQVHQLEEKLSVAQSAAQAAAIAAQSAKSRTETFAQASTSRSAATTTIATPSHLEKISPQALRESVVVLQEQLQEREARIESLESEISTIGRDAPKKLEVRDTEISWLRELLGVRIDDLTDLVNNLQMERFDRGAARNAAIRIKANLQMEQQEKDRVLHGVKPANATPALPSLTDIQKFASPKAAQLTSAFNNWRKGGQTPSLAGLREAVNANTPSRSAPAVSRSYMAAKDPASSSANPQTQDNGKQLKNPIAASAAANAAKPTDAQSFLSGLMTPPASNVRRTPSTSGGSAETERPRTPVRPDSSGSPGVRQEDPTTPPLMRKDDYDLDAELGPDRMEFEGSQDGDAEVEEGARDVTEETVARTKLEPFGEVIASFSTGN